MRSTSRGQSDTSGCWPEELFSFSAEPRRSCRRTRRAWRTRTPEILTVSGYSLRDSKVRRQTSEERVVASPARAVAVSAAATTIHITIIPAQPLLPAR